MGVEHAVFIPKLHFCNFGSGFASPDQYAYYKNLNYTGWLMNKREANPKIAQRNK
jgi:hypothetical protein